MGKWIWIKWESGFGLNVKLNWIKCESGFGLNGNLNWIKWELFGNIIVSKLYSTLYAKYN